MLQAVQKRPLLSLLAIFLPASIVTLSLWPRHLAPHIPSTYGNTRESSTESITWTDDSAINLSPNQAATDDASPSTTLQPGDATGLLLEANGSVSSPNGIYTLTLQLDGDLVLARKGRREERPEKLWWTSTGDGGPPDGHSLLLVPTETGGLLTVLAGTGVRSGAVWHSDLEPGCASRVLAGTSSGGGGKAALELSDSGRLTIVNTCHLYLPTSHYSAHTRNNAPPRDAPAPTSPARGP